MQFTAVHTQLTNSHFGAEVNVFFVDVGKT